MRTVGAESRGVCNCSGAAEIACGGELNGPVVKGDTGVNRVVAAVAGIRSDAWLHIVLEFSSCVEARPRLHGDVAREDASGDEREDRSGVVEPLLLQFSLDDGVDGIHMVEEAKVVE